MWSFGQDQTIESTPETVADELTDAPSDTTRPQPAQSPEAAVVKVPRPTGEKKSKFQQLRDLGDYYMLDEQDLAGATRCYQMALRYATAEELNQSTSDGTWLYRALALDHDRENEHADNQG